MFYHFLKVEWQREMIVLSEMDTAMSSYCEASDSHSEGCYEYWQEEMLQEATIVEHLQLFHEIKQEEEEILGEHSYKVSSHLNDSYFCFVYSGTSDEWQEEMIQMADTDYQYQIEMLRLASDAVEEDNH